jgi:uncharacterized protein YuzE
VRFQYYPETDPLYIDLAEKPGVDSQEAAPGIVLDFDEQGHLVGIDIDQASTVVDWSRFEFGSLPLEVTKAS